MRGFMYRKIEEKIERWIASSKNALLITGARQVGKTYIIREVAKKHFESIIEINFYENELARKTLQGAVNAKDILLRISAITNKELIPGKTLIFLDEVQEYPEIVTAIKFLVEEGSYRYVLSGSLLGVELKGIASIPVGYVNVEKMYPMDFQEFCIANGVSEAVLAHLKECFIQIKEVDEVIHETILKLYYLYLIVGGMPAVVKKYLETNNLQDVVEEQEYISKQYKEDIAKYDPQEKIYLRDIYDLIPSELNEQNKKFKLNSLKNGMRFERAENAFLWLTDAGVAHPIYCANQPKTPLILSKARNQMKLFLCDVGLLASMYSKNIQIQLLNRELDINYGGIFENAVAQELISHNLSLYYYKNNRLGEIDFLTEIDGVVVPIEVKSGKNYKIHSALNNLLNSPEYQIEKAYVFSNYNISREYKKNYMPIYMTMFLENKKQESLVYSVDLKNLDKRLNN